MIAKDGTKNLNVGLLRLVFLDEVYGGTISLRYGCPYSNLSCTLYLTGSQGIFVAEG